MAGTLTTVYFYSLRSGRLFETGSGNYSGIGTRRLMAVLRYTSKSPLLSVRAAGGHVTGLGSNGPGRILGVCLKSEIHEIQSLARNPVHCLISEIHCLKSEIHEIHFLLRNPPLYNPKLKSEIHEIQSLARNPLPKKRNPPCLVCIAQVDT